LSCATSIRRKRERRAPESPASDRKKRKKNIDAPLHASHLFFLVALVVSQNLPAQKTQPGRFFFRFFLFFFSPSPVPAPRALCRQGPLPLLALLRGKRK
jgi:hypothetical protein